jgi:hypothetical protein
MNDNDKFSERFGFAPHDPEITFRYEAPSELRGIIIQIASEVDLGLSDLRYLICRLLRKRPNQRNLSEQDIFLSREVEHLIDGCEWFEVYDIIEEIYKILADEKHVSFAEELNQYFRKAGIGWQLINGHIRIRGPEAFEKIMEQAENALEETRQRTAKEEIHQALLDLSRRPELDITGAIQHALAALECVARDSSGDPKSTLGSILKSNQDLIPKPLDQAIEKVWGFASEYGRHLREGRTPEIEETVLIVGLAASVATYLAKKKIERNDK